MVPRGAVGTMAGTLVLAGVFVAGLGVARATDLSILYPTVRSAPAGPALSPSRPVRVAIPSIGVRAPVNPVGLATDGSIATPPLRKLNEAGWYSGGPAPGQDGPAIIVGHVDSTNKPAVFAKLATVRPGALIEVTRRDRRVAVFRVDTVEQFNKGRLPVQRVYADFSRPAIRLITCGGRWMGGETGYADNVIVFASLVTTRTA